MTNEKINEVNRCIQEVKSKCTSMKYSQNKSELSDELIKSLLEIREKVAKMRDLGTMTIERYGRGGGTTIEDIKARKNVSKEGMNKVRAELQELKTAFKNCDERNQRNALKEEMHKVKEKLYKQFLKEYAIKSRSSLND